MVPLKSLHESLYLILDLLSFNRLIKEIEYSQFWRMVVRIALFQYIKLLLGKLQKG